MAQQDGAQVGRLVMQVVVSVALIYGLLLPNSANPDLANYYFQWLAHIRSAADPWQAFAEPFGNYAPPYLYLLAVASELDLSPLYTVKMLSILGTLFLSLCVWRLIALLKPDKALEAALIVLLLPTVMLNAAMLGQVDAVWAGFCILAVAAGLDRRVYAMAAWAGCGFAFKAQAAFIAPFCLIVMVDQRKWLAAAIPPLVYLAAIAPAWAAGWPLADLLTIYVRQFEFQLLSNAPNLWALPSLLIPDWRNPPAALLAAGATGLAWYLAGWPRPSLRSALIIAILLPFLLSKMHQRYFLLADVLSLCLAFVDRRAVGIFIAVQLASLLAYLDYATGIQALRVAGSVAMGWALVTLLRMGRGAPDQERLMRTMANGKEQGSGSPGLIRTGDHSINSRTLYR